MIIDDKKIAVLGLGYVGLPLAIEFSKLKKVIGFDINNNRVKELQEGRDSTFEADSNSLIKNKNLIFTATNASHFNG